MTRRSRGRDRLRDVLLDQEKMHDLRAALAALTVMASAPEGIETGDMAGLPFMARSARELAHSFHRTWRDAVGHLDPRSHHEAESAAAALCGNLPRAKP